MFTPPKNHFGRQPWRWMSCLAATAQTSRRCLVPTPGQRTIWSTVIRYLYQVPGLYFPDRPWWFHHVQIGPYSKRCYQTSEAIFPDQASSVTHCYQIYSVVDFSCLIPGPICLHTCPPAFWRFFGFVQCERSPGPHSSKFCRDYSVKFQVLSLSELGSRVLVSDLLHS